MEETTVREITTFKYAGQEPVRTSVIEGKIWFVAQDVCKIMGISRYHKAVENLAESERGTLIVATPGGRQSMTTIAESGLFTIMLRSRKPRAKAIRAWVTNTVLPALRTTGTYTIPSVQAPAVPTTFSAALYLAAKQAEQIEQQTQQLALAAPKVAFFDTVASSSDTTDIGTVAKTLAVPGLGRTNLFDLLRKKSILQDNNRPYQRYVDAGYFRVIETSWTDPDGNQHLYFKTVVYQRGLDFIRQLVQRAQI
jgi:prophage antirepressor-like protein